jgi:hypothetical protein
MPEPKKHAQGRGVIESVLRHIPGFKGYLEKEYRRESDELQREWLADRLQRGKRGLDEFTSQLADVGQISALPKIDRLRGKLDKMIARIRGAMQGYSGFFDLVQISEAQLDQVYQHDVTLMESVAKLADGVDALRHDSRVDDAKIYELNYQIEALDDAWDRREDMLKGLD